MRWLASAKGSQPGSTSVMLAGLPLGEVIVVSAVSGAEIGSGSTYCHAAQSSSEAWAGVPACRQATTSYVEVSPGPGGVQILIACERCY